MGWSANQIEIINPSLKETFEHLELNKIIEAIEYASDAYWGDPQLFQFRAMIDSFGFQTELTSDDERIVRSTFNIRLNGYIVPEILQKDINSLKKFSDKTKIIFSVEASSLDALYNGNVIGDRIITADPARQRNLTFVSTDAQEIIIKLLTYDHTQRLSAGQALRHAYFKDLREADKSLVEN